MPGLVRRVTTAVCEGWLTAAAAWTWLGRQPFDRTAALQERLREQILAGRGPRDPVALRARSGHHAGTSCAARSPASPSGRAGARRIQILRGQPGRRGHLPRPWTARLLSRRAVATRRAGPRGRHGASRDRLARGARHRRGVASHLARGVGWGIQDLRLRGPGAARCLRPWPRVERQHRSGGLLRHRALRDAWCQRHVRGAAPSRKRAFPAQPGAFARQVSGPGVRSGAGAGPSQPVSP